MSDNLYIWNKVKQPPTTALKPITGGRLKGKSDINPQWRYQSMTECFGICGVGWKYEIVRLWTEPASDGQVFAFAQINLFTQLNVVDSLGHRGQDWSEPIPSTGGAMLVEKEREGLHANDEAFKMAITDALGTAMKMLGVAADIYLGNFDGTKYRNAAVIPEPLITEAQVETLKKLIDETTTDFPKFLAYFKISLIRDFPIARFTEAIKMLERKKEEGGKGE